jgi:hypothetical protein
MLIDALVKLSKQWMAVLASVWLLAAIGALIKGEWSWAAVCVVLSVLLWDSYRRDKRSRAQEGPGHRSEA